MSHIYNQRIFHVYVHVSDVIKLIVHMDMADSRRHFQVGAGS